MTDQNKMSEDELDVTQLPPQVQNDQLDSNPSSDSGWKGENEEREAEIHSDEQEPPRRGEVDHLGNPKMDPTSASFLEDRLFETLPSSATPLPNASLPDDERREDHVSFTEGRSDPPEVQGNLPQDSDKTGSSGAPQESTPTNEVPSTQNKSPENVFEDVANDDDKWDPIDEKPTLHFAGQESNSQFDRSSDNKPPQVSDSVTSEYETTTSNAEQSTSDPGQLTSDPSLTFHSDTDQQNKERDSYNDNENGDDYYDDHYWDDVPEPEHVSDANTGQVEEPATSSSFGSSTEEVQQQRSPIQDVSEDGDVRSSNDIQSDTPTEAPPTEATPSTFTPTDTYRSEFASPVTSQPPSEFESSLFNSTDAQPSSSNDETPPPENKDFSSEFDLFSFEKKAPPSGAETEAPPLGAEPPPPSQGDGSDQRQVGTGSSSLASSLIDPNYIDLRSIDSLRSQLHPSPSVTLLPRAEGVDHSEETNKNADSAEDNVERVHSSQLPSQEQKPEPEKDAPGVVVDGTRLPDEDNEDVNVADTTLFQSPVFTQSIVPTPIPGSDSTNTDIGINNQSPSLDEIKARGELLRTRLDSNLASHLDNSSDSHIVQETLPAQDIAAADGDASSTTTDRHSEVRFEGGRSEDQHILTVENTPADQVHVPSETDRSQPAVEEGATLPPPSGDPYKYEEGGVSETDTPTTPPVETDSMFEEPPPPPASGAGVSYSCRDDYLAMPGHNRGGSMAYFEGIRSGIRDMVLNALPDEWSDWVCHNVSSYIML